ncbi:hypothetical protein [Polyangium fumosum]|uniref:hypothetical protein n=1 Tax=Polyangium fumosum TaxID=889272 RepID=UPI00147808B6|nr:hypothetical protein [Polyangium fumosum]
MALLFCASAVHAVEFRVCVKPPDVPPGLTQWAYEQGSATVWTTRSRVEFARKVEGRATYIFDPHAPPESVRILPIPYNTLKCPPPPPKPAPAKEPPKEAKKAEDGSTSKGGGKSGGDEARKSGGEEDSVERRVEKHLVRSQRRPRRLRVLRHRRSGKIPFCRDKVFCRASRSSRSERRSGRTRSTGSWIEAARSPSSWTRKTASR